MTGLAQIGAFVLAVILIAITVMVALGRGRGIDTETVKPTAAMLGALVCAVILAGHTVYQSNVGGLTIATIVCCAGALCGLVLAGSFFRLRTSR